MIPGIFAWYFRFKGWKIEGKGIPPHIKKCVVIAMPHTSNWDFVYAIGALRLFGIRLNYLAKKELFRWPIKSIFTGTGGIPVERKKNTRMVETITRKFSEEDKLILAISVEGTRKRVGKIKTGFYHVAISAGVPLCMAYLDYRKKVAGFSEPFYPTGNAETDAKIIREFYRDKAGKFPGNFNPDAIILD